ncbi:MAG: HupE/UreJ family protein [Pseudomonadota bacterium]
MKGGAFLVTTLAILLTFMLPVDRAQGHALEPGYLEIAPIEDDSWRVIWRKPQVAGAPMGIDAVLPDTCTPRRGPEPRFDGRAFVSGWVATCTAPIWEGALFIDGLDRTATDVLVRFTPEIGATSQTLRLTPDATSVVLPEVPSLWGVLSSYFALGVDHIMGGIDHLLFVFALLLLIPDVGRLIWAITAFTVAHSLTLAAASLGWVALPIPPVEAVISLSIVFLASEILRRRDGAPGLMERAPWIAAFAFGLLHGLGFASALREIGLPEGDVPAALLAFNLGVEAGQLMFVACVLVLALVVRRIAPDLMARQRAPGAPGLTVAAYAIGSVAAFWTIERIAGFVA